MAGQILRDPYNFDFLTLANDFKERELERGLLVHLRDLLLELGRGFAFVGSQVPLVVGEETFYLDLLFYHLRLHAYFVIELKTGRFKPEYAGKLTPAFLKTTILFSCLFATAATPPKALSQDAKYAPEGEQFPAPICLTFEAALLGGRLQCEDETHKEWLRTLRTGATSGESASVLTAPTTPCLN